MFIHGKAEEADALVTDIEGQVMASAGVSELKPAEKSIKVREQKSVGLITIAKTVFGAYPRRTVVGLALFIGQAFLYNAVFFTYALVLSKFYDVKPASVGYYIIPFAIGNFLGPLVLGHVTHRPQGIAAGFDSAKPQARVVAAQAPGAAGPARDTLGVEHLPGVDQRLQLQDDELGVVGRSQLGGQLQAGVGLAVRRHSEKDLVDHRKPQLS